MNFQKLSLILLLSAAPFAIKAMDLSVSTFTKIAETEKEQIAVNQQKAMELTIEVALKKDFAERKDQAIQALEALPAIREARRLEKAKLAVAKKARAAKLKTILNALIKRRGDITKSNGYEKYCASLDLLNKETTLELIKKELATLALAHDEFAALKAEAKKDNTINLGAQKSIAEASYAKDIADHKAKLEATEKAKSTTTSSRWNILSWGK